MSKRKRKPRRTSEKTRLVTEIDSDADFYFIAGYTPNDVPYGITWEEAREQGLIDDRQSDEPPAFDH